MSLIISSLAPSASLLSTTPSSTAAPRFDAERALGLEEIVTLRDDQCRVREDAPSILFSLASPATTSPTDNSEGPTDSTNTSPTEIEHPETHPEATGGEVGNAFAKWARVGAYACVLGMSCEACSRAIADGGVGRRLAGLARDVRYVLLHGRANSSSIGSC
jgi:hypothetical protein